VKARQIGGSLVNVSTGIPSSPREILGEELHEADGAANGIVSVRVKSGLLIALPSQEGNGDAILSLRCVADGYPLGGC